jgi:hypothetical protein
LTLRFVHTHSAARLFCRPPRLLSVELKREDGELTTEQANWIHWLEQCPGVEVFCWRPSDWPSIVETWR